MPCFCFHKVQRFPFLHPHTQSHMAVSCALHKRSGSLGGEHIRGDSAHVGPEVELPQVLLVEMAHNRCGVTAHRKQQGRTWGTTRNGASCQENSDPWVLCIALVFAQHLGTVAVCHSSSQFKNITGQPPPPLPHLALFIPSKWLLNLGKELSKLSCK